MKTQMKPMIWLVTLLALFCAPHLASAYYDPGVQRWINRDPCGEVGFEIARTGLPTTFWLLRAAKSIETANPYEGISNDEIDHVDADGRSLWQGVKDIGEAVKNCWKFLSCTVGAATGAAGLADAYQQIQAARGGWANYHSAEAMLTRKFGDSEDWPPALREDMANWRSALFKQFGAAAAACYKATPGTPASGPVDNPIR